ncbi:MAG: glycerol-3-phosphate dehydrogenase/oxidase [Nocardioides sp.]|uniref:glycerol-3-phosphate dehydrogenase/oxidase n=1 Tax=Nocardioides sp. TaxID=35761 RepID=UPI003F05049C
MSHQINWPAPAAGAEARIGVGSDHLPDEVDLVVAGLGVTGAGVALDAASRGLTVLAVDASDVAHGTSRWSSKLVHGGLRYLAKGQVGVAHESAVERGVLMEVTAPHLSHPMPLLLPLHAGTSATHGSVARLGFVAGDLLRRAARTDVETLPHPRRVTATEALSMAPELRTAGLRGGLLSWDGQLEDDARLVTTLVRTAVAHGAVARTRLRVLEASGTQVLLRDELTGATHVVRTRAVVNATGVWADDLVPEIRLRPSRGTHLVLRGEALGGLRVSVTVPIPGTFNRYALVLPQPDGLVYVGLTDEPAPGPVPDVPQPTETEIGFLLDVVGAAFSRPLRRSDVVGAYAGLRPLLDTGTGATADLSRRHAVLTSSTGVVTVVGGKLTTYRRMAQDAVDAALEAAGTPAGALAEAGAGAGHGGLNAGPCVTRSLPLLGAAPRETLAETDGPARLVRRFGTEAELVLDVARGVSGLTDDELLAPASATVPVTLAELVFGVTHEGARTVEDLLHRRTRVGLVPADLAAAVPLAERALALAGVSVA